jgi:hypothetical protein
MHKLLRRIAYYYPLTFLGSLLAAVSVYLLGMGYAYKNPFSLFLGMLGLFLLILFAVLGRVQANRLEKQQVSWESYEPVFAGRKGAHHRFDVPGERAFFFYRYHFTITGDLRVGKTVRLWYYRENSFPGGGGMEIPLLFPLCGVFFARGRASVKDIFGLSRARFLGELEREIPVQPTLLKEKREVSVQATGGEDSKQKRKTSDEEKYYMRDYIPGDKFRDINWKASTKLNDIFTRISPVTQEKMKIIHVDFRHYKKEPAESLESIYHLHYIKNWLISFLWNSKRDHPEYQFHLSTGEGTVLLESEDDIKRFSMYVPKIFYQHSPAALRETGGVERLFVFSTPFDEGLNGYLRRFSNIPVTVFRTRFPQNGKEQNGEGSLENVELFRLPSHPYVPAPALFRRHKKKKNPGVDYTRDINEQIVSIELI